MSSDRAARVLGGREDPLAFAVAYGIAVGLGALLEPLMRRNGPTGLDTDVTCWFVGHRSSALTWWAKGVTWLGSSVVVIPIALTLIGLLLWRRRRVLALFVALAVGGAAVLNVLVKQTIGRDRPPLQLRMQHPSDSSFTSGHSAAGRGDVPGDRGRRHRAHPVPRATVSRLARGRHDLRLRRVVARLPGRPLDDRRARGWSLGAIWVAALVLALNRARSRRPRGRDRAPGSPALSATPRRIPARRRTRARSPSSVTNRPGPASEHLMGLGPMRAASIFVCLSKRGASSSSSCPPGPRPATVHRARPSRSPSAARAQLVRRAVHQDAVLGEPRSLGPAAAELETDDGPSADTPGTAAPVPASPVGPSPAPDVEHTPCVGSGRGAERPRAVANDELAARRARLMLRRELEAAVAPRDHHVQRLVPGRKLDVDVEAPGAPSRSRHRA